MHGVVYEIDDDESELLDDAEPRYRSLQVETSAGEARTYSYEGEAHRALPWDWYVASVVSGVAEHGLPTDGVDVPSIPEPKLGSVRPAGPEDHLFIRGLLSRGMQSDSPRHYPHPGEFSWWIHHSDPRYQDHLSTWVWERGGFALINSRSPREISLFADSGVDRRPFIDWCLRWLAGPAELGWISDTDPISVELDEAGASIASTDRRFEWDLTRPIPKPELPAGWSLRHVAGEGEANARRHASHRSFRSTMEEKLHLERYLRFMRSDAYVPERDLVVVDGSGRVGAFMVWWGDESGIAQIEPFGTDPDLHRMGLGRALLRFGAQRAQDAGMHTLRVSTYDDWPAATFYERSGFDAVGKLHWWEIGSS